MPVLKKWKLLQIVATLQEANEELRKRGPKRADDIIEVLTQGQELAIKIGTDIDGRKEHVAKEIVAALEEYCESVYQFSLDPLNKSVCDKQTKKIKGLLIRVNNAIKYELNDDKRDMVFLPYKASMWDSLESIWIAANEDENCNAIVIPIPYFDKNPDGSLGKMHYEGNEFPKDIPITSWKEYSIEANRPDVIYVHNPYDSWNLITSVHPMFYSSELVNYTNELVYVPYFVLQEIEPENQTAIDRIKHFITTPGVIYADKVIVQSKNMKQIYVNVYIDWAEEQGLMGKHVDRKYQETRILGIGSPKFDKVLNVKKGDFIIPEEWERKIGNKKIILFNSSINAALNNGSDYLDKLEKVFTLLKKREDFILWWRPHPLLASTFDSMRPNLSKRYKRIVSEYKNENYGIYDDTADLNRAIACSDRYYGDRSSVLQLYGATGKPALISIIKQRPRGEMLVKNWRTGDFEENDLIDWIEGKEKWIIGETYKNAFKDLNLDGENGSKIHQICVGGQI